MVASVSCQPESPYGSNKSEKQGQYGFESWLCYYVTLDKLFDLSDSQFLFR